MQILLGLLLCLPLFYAASVPFVPASDGPVEASPNYGDPSNFTLPKPDEIVGGKVFDRFIQIWLENTDATEAAAAPIFQQLAAQGITLSNFLALTHPSEPNYVATVGGDFFGMADDAFYNINTNVSTIVDLLEEKKLSWAEYQESMLTDGSGDFSDILPNYVNPSLPPHQFYVRKHNPLIIYNSVALHLERAKFIRNFNDFAADFNNSALPQWIFITPNKVDDGHDTDIDYSSRWLEFWLLPLLADKRFNDERTLILLTFDENESHGINNNVFSLLLGGAVPKHLLGTVDDTFYTHFSALSTVQVNWDLGCLGRQDTNKTVSNVYSFVAEKTKYENVHLDPSEFPLFNITRTIPGPLNPRLFIPFSFFPPDVSATCANPKGKVFVAPGVDTTRHPKPAPVDLVALNQTVPDAGPPKRTPTNP